MVLPRSHPAPLVRPHFEPDSVPSRPVRVLILVNERSGRGKAALLGAGVETALRQQGGEVLALRAAEATLEAIRAWGPRAIVVCGGDGTVHHLVQQAFGQGLEQWTVYHAPTGTENLFAREFGMWPRVLPDEIARRVLRDQSRLIDLGIAGERSFALMMSVGFDAAVVERVCAIRTGRITRWSYAKPILREATRPTLARMRVRIDGERIVDAHRGLLVVGNVRQYAARLNPTCNADPSDGLLDVTFMAASSAMEIIRWSALCWSRAQHAAVGCVMARGHEIEIESLEHEAAVQMDGESAGRLIPGKPGVIRVAPASMRVVQVSPRRA